MTLFLIQFYHFLLDFGVKGSRVKPLISKFQGTHGTGKTGKMAKNIPCQGKHREFGNFVKTQGI